jgi:hypothetical protein
MNARTKKVELSTFSRFMSIFSSFIDMFSGHVDHIAKRGTLPEPQRTSGVGIRELSVQLATP